MVTIVLDFNSQECTAVEEGETTINSDLPKDTLTNLTTEVEEVATEASQHSNARDTSDFDLLIQFAHLDITF